MRPPRLAAATMLLCAICGRKIDADEVKYRATIDGKSVTLCADDAKKRGI